MWVSCWERLRAGGEGDDRGWDSWMASSTWLTRVWVDSGSCWWTGRPGVLWFMGSQRVRHDWVTELNWTELLWNKNFLKTSYSNWPSLPQNRNDLEFLYFLWQHIYLHDGCVLISYSHVPLFVNLWTVAHQAPLFMEFSRQESWRRLPYPPPGDLPSPGIEPRSLTSPALAGEFFTTRATWEVLVCYRWIQKESS